MGSASPATYQGNASSNTSAAGWVTAHVYNQGDVVRPSPGTGQVFLAIAGGTSGGSQPAWSGPTFPTIGTQFTDNTVTWMCLATEPGPWAPVIQLPVDSDPPLAFGQVIPNSTLADQMAWLNSNAGLLASNNTWTGTNTFTPAGSGSYTAVSATGGSPDGTGVIGTGAGSGAGVEGDADATGNGVQGFGGSTSGSGVYGEALGGNSDGVDGHGHGAGAGVNGTGGSTGPGVNGTGGGTSPGVKGTGGSGGGLGGTFQATGTNNAGIFGEGIGNGPGVGGEGGDNGPGVQGNGGSTSGVGVKGVATVAGSAGVEGDAAGSGVGVLGVPGADDGSIGVSGSGNGSGAGVLGTNNSTGPGVSGSNSDTGPGVIGTNDGTGYGGQFSANAAAINLVPQTTPSSGAAGDLWADETTPFANLWFGNGTNSNGSVNQTIAAALGAGVTIGDSDTLIFTAVAIPAGFYEIKFFVAGTGNCSASDLQYPVLTTTATSGAITLWNANGNGAIVWNDASENFAGGSIPFFCASADTMSFSLKVISGSANAWAILVKLA